MATDEERPAIPPIPGLRPLTEAEAVRLTQMAARGLRAEEAAQKLPHDEPKPTEKRLVEHDKDKRETTDNG